MRATSGLTRHPGASLAARASTPLAGLSVLALLVLVMHALALAWLGEQWQSPAQLQPLVAPMLTRQLLPAAPAATPVPRHQGSQQNLPPSPASQAQTAINSVATESQTPTLVPPTPAPSPPPPERTETPAQPGPLSPPPAVASVPSTPEAATPTDTWPADTRLSYQLGGNYRGELHGTARVQWLRDRQDRQRYEARIHIDIGWLVSMVMVSQGTLGPRGLEPKAYEESVRGARRSLLVDNTTVTLGNGDKVLRPAGVQDTASQFVELGHRFATGREVLETGRAVPLWLARPGGVDLWTYDVTEKVTLHTPHLGAVEAWHLKPRPLANPRGPISSEIWFAPALQYLPVRIRITLGENTFIDLLVDRIEQAELPAAP